MRRSWSVLDFSATGKEETLYYSFKHHILVISAAELKNVNSRRMWLKFYMPGISL